MSDEQTGDEASKSSLTPSYGIITALEEEYAAIWALLDLPIVTQRGREHAPRPFIIGRVFSGIDQGHIVVLSLLPAMGTNSASARATLLCQLFPSVHTILMVGIAGGAPNPNNPDQYVRLGDVVFSNQYGAIQFDNQKLTLQGVEHRGPNFPPDQVLLEHANHLKAGQRLREFPWMDWIRLGSKRLGIRRPPSITDIMLWPNEDGQRIPFNHPQDPRRKYGRPLIFSGVIGSSNTLLKQYEVRDRLRGDFGFRAIEMEGAGIAEATWSVRAGYFVVRGICDYCDENKNDKWHDYAALTAAAFAITLLKTVEGHPLPKVVQLESIDPASGLVVAEECFRYVLHELSKDDVFPDRCDRCQEKLRLAHQSITRYWAWSGVKGSAANALVDRLAFDEALLETSDLTAEYRTICLDRTQVSLQRRQMLIRRVTQHLDELTELSGR